MMCASAPTTSTPVVSCTTKNMSHATQLYDRRWRYERLGGSSFMSGTMLHLTIIEQHLIWYAELLPNSTKLYEIRKSRQPNKYPLDPLKPLVFSQTQIKGGEGHQPACRQSDRKQGDIFGPPRLPSVRIIHAAADI